MERYHPKVLQVLIEKGAQIDSQTNFGSTALHVAVNNQDTDCVRLLIQRGCNINLQVPLHILHARILNTYSN